MQPDFLPRGSIETSNLPPSPPPQEYFQVLRNSHPSSNDHLTNENFHEEDEDENEKKKGGKKLLQHHHHRKFYEIFYSSRKKKKNMNDENDENEKMKKKKEIESDEFLKFTLFEDPIPTMTTNHEIDDFEYLTYSFSKVKIASNDDDDDDSNKKTKKKYRNVNDEANEVLLRYFNILKEKLVRRKEKMKKLLVNERFGDDAFLKNEIFYLKNEMNSWKLLYYQFDSFQFRKSLNEKIKFDQYLVGKRIDMSDDDNNNEKIIKIKTVMEMLLTKKNFIDFFVVQQWLESIYEKPVKLYHLKFRNDNNESNPVSGEFGKKDENHEFEMKEFYKKLWYLIRGGNYESCKILCLEYKQFSYFNLLNQVLKDIKDFKTAYKVLKSKILTGFRNGEYDIDNLDSKEDDETSDDEDEDEDAVEGRKKRMEDEDELNAKFFNLLGLGVKENKSYENRKVVNEKSTILNVPGNYLIKTSEESNIFLEKLSYLELMNYEFFNPRKYLHINYMKKFNHMNLFLEDKKDVNKLNKLDKFYVNLIGFLNCNLNLLNYTLNNGNEEISNIYSNYRYYDYLWNKSFINLEYYKSKVLSKLLSEKSNVHPIVLKVLKIHKTFITKELKRLFKKDNVQNSRMNSVENNKIYVLKKGFQKIQKYLILKDYRKLVIKLYEIFRLLLKLNDSRLLNFEIFNFLRFSVHLILFLKTFINFGGKEKSKMVDEGEVDNEQETIINYMFINFIYVLFLNKNYDLIGLYASQIGNKVLSNFIYLKYLYSLSSSSNNYFKKLQKESIEIGVQYNFNMFRLLLNLSNYLISSSSRKNYMMVLNWWNIFESQRPVFLFFKNLIIRRVLLKKDENSNFSCFKSIILYQNMFNKNTGNREDGQYDEEEEEMEGERYFYKDFNEFISSRINDDFEFYINEDYENEGILPSIKVLKSEYLVYLLYYKFEQLKINFLNRILFDADQEDDDEIINFNSIFNQPSSNENIFYTLLFRKIKFQRYFRVFNNLEVESEYDENIMKNKNVDTVFLKDFEIRKLKESKQYIVYMQNLKKIMETLYRTIVKLVSTLNSKGKKSEKEEDEEEIEKEPNEENEIRQTEMQRIKRKILPKIIKFKQFLDFISNNNVDASNNSRCIDFFDMDVPEGDPTTVNIDVNELRKIQVNSSFIKIRQIENKFFNKKNNFQ